VGVLSTLSSFFFGRPSVGRPAAPTKQVSGGGVHHTGGWIVGAERNPKLVGTNRHALYHQGIANTDAVATPLRALLWLVGDVDWDVEPAVSAEDQAAASAYGKPPIAGSKPPRPGDPGSAGKPQAGTQPYRAPGRPIGKAEYNLKGPKTPEEAVDWVKKVLFEEMRTPWKRLVRRLCTYRPHGFSVHEWVAKIREEDGTYGLLDIVEVPQTTVTRWNLDDTTAELYGVVQQVPATGQEVYLSRKRMVYIVDDALAQGDPAGMGLMRHCVEKIDQLRRFEQLEGVGYETELVGVPKGSAPLAEMQALVEQGTWSAADVAAATKVLDDFIQGHIKTPSLGLVLDSAVYRDVGENAAPSGAKKWDLELLKSSGAPHADMGKGIERKGREIARIWSAEGFYLGGGDGSQALSREKTRMFGALCNATTGDIAETIDRDVIRPIWDLNRFDPELRPKVCPSRVDLDDVPAVATAMKDWSAAQLAPEDPATNAFRKRLRLPALPIHVAQAQAEMKLAEQQAQLAATEAKTEATINPPVRPAPPGAARPAPNKPAQ
jgi:hypothetical protein